jgi:hypothetical protein
MPIPSKYSSDLKPAPAHLRKVPEQWKTLSLSQLSIILKGDWKPMPEDWIEHRINELRLLRIIDPTNPLCK